jgi:hypothetical protein
MEPDSGVTNIPNVSSKHWQRPVSQKVNSSRAPGDDPTLIAPESMGQRARCRRIHEGN